jgi:hypothetical protein
MTEVVAGPPPDRDVRWTKRAGAGWDLRVDGTIFGWITPYRYGRGWVPHVVGVRRFKGIRVEDGQRYPGLCDTKSKAEKVILDCVKEYLLTPTERR